MPIMTLGDFTFQAQEIPEVIPFGLEQRMSVKKLVGGKRVIDAIGVDPIPLRWSGRFFGPNSLERARRLKAFCEAGLPLDLTWGVIVYSVVVKSFVGDYRFNEIPYTIECEVLEDRGTTPPQDATPGINGLFNADLAAAQIQAAQVNQPVLNSSMATLSAAASAVPDFSIASLAQLAPVQSALAGAQTAVSTLQATNDSVLTAAGTLGGLLPGAQISKSVSGLTSCLSAATSQGPLVALQGLLGRISFNIARVSAGIRTVTVTGGSLFDLASKYYGNPDGWTQIAKANNLSDPNLSGIQTLTIPAFSSDSGGVLA